MIYVIWSHEHHAWWRPEAMGYTPFLEEAGHYTAEEAAKPVLNDVKNDEIAILLGTALKNGPPTFHPYHGDQSERQQRTRSSYQRRDAARSPSESPVSE